MAANKTKGEVSFPAITVEGFTGGGVLVLDFNALCQLEDELGLAVDQLSTDALKSPGKIRTIFRIALGRHHGEVSAATAGDIIQAIGLLPAVELVVQALAASFPEAATDGTANPPRKPQGAGTGKTATAAG
jgi:hypothetical protein